MFETQVNCHQPAAFLFILLTLIFNKKFLLIFFLTISVSHTHIVCFDHIHPIISSCPSPTPFETLFFPNILPPNSVSSNVNSPLRIIRLAYVGRGSILLVYFCSAEK